MGIRHIEGKRGHDLAVFCDVCKGEITDGHMANFEWCSELECRRHRHRTFFVHKECCRKLDLMTGPCVMLSDELERFPIFLMNATKMKYEKCLQRVKDIVEAFG